jgi:hypothetical protein
MPYDRLPKKKCFFRFFGGNNPDEIGIQQQEGKANDQRPQEHGFPDKHAADGCAVQQSHQGRFQIQMAKEAVDCPNIVSYKY